jgi:hypothetical protein
MTTHEIVDYLRGLADATIVVAEAEDTNRVSRARLQMQASVLLEACDTMLKQTGELEQLRERLVRQACWFEQFEARAEPKSWPLLDDDGCDDAGAAL